MALPFDYLSSTPEYAPFQYGDSLTTRNLVDYEIGGIGLNDVTQGLLIKLWKIEVVGSDVILSENGTNPSTLFSASGITEVSFTFDQNMNPFVAYVQNGVAKYRWYDSTISDFDTITMASTVKNPRCCLDDKRSDMTTLNKNDIVLAYLNNKNLCYRLQRERFETERILKTDVVGKLIKVGMNQGNKLQFMLKR